MSGSIGTKLVHELIRLGDSIQALIHGVSNPDGLALEGINPFDSPGFAVLIREANEGGLKPGVCSGLILSGAFYPDLKIGVWRRERIKLITGFQNILGKEEN